MQHLHWHPMPQMASASASTRSTLHSKCGQLVRRRHSTSQKYSSQSGQALSDGRSSSWHSQAVHNRASLTESLFNEGSTTRTSVYDSCRRNCGKHESRGLHPDMSLGPSVLRLATHRPPKPSTSLQTRPRLTCCRVRWIMDPCEVEKHLSEWCV